MWHSIPMSFYWEKISQFSFPIYDLKIVATVTSKERRNSSLTWSFYFCISGQFCSLWVVPFPLWSFPFVCFCGFLPVVPPPFVYFIPNPQLYVTHPSFKEQCSSFVPSDPTDSSRAHIPLRVPTLQCESASLTPDYCLIWYGFFWRY